MEIPRTTTSQDMYSQMPLLLLWWAPAEQLMAQKRDELAAVDTITVAVTEALPSLVISSWETPLGKESLERLSWAGSRTVVSR